MDHTTTQDPIMTDTPPRVTLTPEEAIRLIEEIDAHSLKIRLGEIVPRVIRHADRGNTAFSIECREEVHKLPAKTPSQS